MQARRGVCAASVKLTGLFSELAAHDRYRPPARLRIFIDGPLVELFVEPHGQSITIALPGTDLDWSLEVDGTPSLIAWRVRS